MRNGAEDPRPHGSNTERLFIKRFLAPLKVTRDKGDNIWCRIGESPILWSCHTDTVHKKEGFQNIAYGDGIVTPQHNTGECLGADCTTGVWLMRQMILAGVPGNYVFHSGEEVGGLGAKHIAKNAPYKLANIKFAIAFDRKGTSEIITHQMMERCASDAFARSLAAALNMDLKPSNGGTFTDTACYTHLIPECTNIAVGYLNQHSPREQQNVPFAEELLANILKADFSTLVCERDPHAPPEYDDDVWGSYYPANNAPKKSRITDSPLLAYVKDYPQDVADFLEANGFDVEDIEDYVFGDHRYSGQLAESSSH